MYFLYNQPIPFYKVKGTIKVAPNFPKWLSPAGSTATRSEGFPIVFENKI